MAEVIADDAEYVVISRPSARVQGFAPAPVHAHHDRAVVCKKSATEIVIEPIHGHNERHRYVRTENKDKDGRPIFVEAK